MQQRSKKWKRNKSGGVDSMDACTSAIQPLSGSVKSPERDGAKPVAQRQHSEQDFADESTALVDSSSVLVWADEHYKLPTIWQPVELFKLLWQRYEATFAISMLETWESVLLHCILLFLVWLLYWACWTYLPNHIRVVSGRVLYYILGSDSSATKLA